MTTFNDCAKMVNGQWLKVSCDLQTAYNQINVGTAQPFDGMEAYKGSPFMVDRQIHADE